MCSSAFKLTVFHPSIYNFLNNHGMVLCRYLHNNKLTGSIPPELGNMSKLHYQELNDNMLTGHIPPELGNTILEVIKREYKVHSYNRNGLCVVGFMDDHYPVRSAFSVLNQVIDEYQKKHGDSWKSVQADKTDQWPYLNDALTRFQDPAQADKLLKIQRELDETKIILHKTIESVLEIVVDAFSDGSSFVFQQCGGLVSNDCRDEHYTFWCGHR